jgi:hypothetical protein
MNNRSIFLTACAFVISLTACEQPLAQQPPQPAQKTILASNLSDSDELQSLPLYARKETVNRTDWLTHPVQIPAGVFRTDNDNEIILCNGLIRRVFRLSPNGATVGFDNLMTGQSILRGVKPEARIEIDGVSYEIGGLKGQPKYAFLHPAWVDGLKTNPNSFQFTGFEVGKPKERFPWKQTRHYDQRAQWPPKGVYLRMDYRMPEPADSSLSELTQSELGRTRLIADTFEALSTDWEIHVSGAHPRSSFENEGKVGEIYTPANTSVFAERPLPEDTKLVEVQIDAGTDTSASWGPGIALVWPDRVIKFNLRPGGNAYDAGIAMFGTYNGQKENSAVGGRQKLDLSQPVDARNWI